jgi:hypothetical protein
MKRCLALTCAILGRSRCGAAAEHEASQASEQSKEMRGASERAGAGAAKRDDVQHRGGARGEVLEAFPGVPPPPPKDVTQILGEKPPEFPEGACGRAQRVAEESEEIKMNLAVLSALQESQKLWVDMHSDLVRAQIGGAFSRMLYRQVIFKSLFNSRYVLFDVSMLWAHGKCK